MHCYHVFVEKLIFHIHGGKYEWFKRSGIYVADVRL